MSEYRQNEPLSENEISSEPNAEAIQKATPPKASFASSILDTLEMFVFALCAVILVLTSVFRLCTVSGASMENTFYAEEKLLISDFFYTPERGDVIVFHQTGPDEDDLNEPIVKRVIATEGETVSISYDEKGKMLILVTDTDGNVTELQEDYAKYEGGNRYAPQTVTVPEGHVFVLGDNRNNSSDSRDPNVGFVSEDSILGNAIFRLLPLSQIGTLD